MFFTQKDLKSENNNPWFKPWFYIFTAHNQLRVPQQILYEAEILHEGIISLIHLFARAFLLMKNLKIEETKATWNSTFKTDTYNKSGLSFFEFNLFLCQIYKWALAAVI